jgi:hypothetical protein
MIRIIPGTEGILRNDVFSKADWITFGIIQLLKNRLKTEDECGIVSIGYIEGAIDYERASVVAEKCGAAGQYEKSGTVRSCDRSGDSDRAGGVDDV